MAEARYQIERMLGSGGMATVYLAHDRELGRPVALKVLAENLAADAEYRARFLREARMAAGLAHPNVVQVYDIGEDERGLFIVMEYVEGETLAATLRRRGRLPPEEAVRIGIQVCAGLEQAHAAGLVHRDIKPQNILLSREGTAKISDFGIARRLDGTGLTEHGAVLGSATYLAPEQARGEPVSAAADLYALGVVLYELLTGRPPFEADSLAALVLQRERGRIVPPREHASGIPPALEDVVMGCLARLPEHRPESAASLAQALAGSQSQTPAQPPLEPTGSLATKVLTSAPTKRLRRIRSKLGSDARQAESAPAPRHRAGSGAADLSGRRPGRHPRNRRYKAGERADAAGRTTATNNASHNASTKHRNAPRNDRTGARVRRARAAQTRARAAEGRHRRTEAQHEGQGRSAKRSRNRSERSSNKNTSSTSSSRPAAKGPPHPTTRLTTGTERGP